jgi:hypothetical protein
VTPARFKSCMRLLRGITLQAQLNRSKMQAIVARRDRLKGELESLARFIGEDRFADHKLLTAMSRRIGHTSTELESVKHDLALAHKKDMKFDRAKTVLTQRIRLHEIEREEENLMDLTTVRLSLKRFGQCATRTRC